MQVALTGLIASEGGNVPTDFVLVKAGSNAYDGGEFIFDEEAASSVMSTWKKRGIRLTADYEHQSLTAHKMQGGVPAAAKGWTPAVVDGALRATDVQWTPKAKQMIADGEISYFSIYGDVDPKTKRLTKIVNFALTNNPAAHAITPLAASAALTSTEDNDMKTVAIALGLSAGAEEADVLAAVSSTRDFERTVLTLSGKASRNEAVGALTAKLALAERAATLETELATLRLTQKTTEVNTLVDEAVKDGRVPPAKREAMIALSQSAGIDGLKACLDMLPKQNVTAAEAKKETAAAGSDAADVLTLADKKIALSLGRSMDEMEEFRKMKLRLAAEDEMRKLARKDG